MTTTDRAPAVRPHTGDGSATGARPVLMLVLATVGFGVNFWAWALLSPLGPRFKESLGLTAFEQALLVAVPVVVGSVGRIPVGALTDRFGGRVLGLAGHLSLPALLVGGLLVEQRAGLELLRLGLGHPAAAARA